MHWLIKLGWLLSGVIVFGLQRSEAAAVTNTSASLSLWERRGGGALTVVTAADDVVPEQRPEQSAVVVASTGRAQGSSPRGIEAIINRLITETVVSYFTTEIEPVRAPLPLPSTTAETERVASIKPPAGAACTAPVLGLAPALASKIGIALRTVTRPICAVSAVVPATGTRPSRRSSTCDDDFDPPSQRAVVIDGQVYWVPVQHDK